MMRDKFGIDPRSAERFGARASFAMGGSFAAGHSIPALYGRAPVAAR